MSVVAFCSVRGAPGVTTTSLLVASGIRDAVVVEADLSGGALAIRYDLGREPGLTTLAATRPGEPSAWRDHAQGAGGVAVLVGPDDPASGAGLWRTAGGRLADIIKRSDAGAAVVDLGRLTSHTPLLAVADLAVIVVRPTAEHLVTLTHHLASLREHAGSAQICALLVGDGPYRESGVNRALGVSVIGHLPDDRRATTHIEQGRGSAASFARSGLARAASNLSDTVARSLRVQVSRVGADR